MLLAAASLALLGSCGATRVAPPPPPPVFDSTHEISDASVLGDVGAAPQRLWRDTKLVFGDGTNWLLLGGAGAYALVSERYWEDQEADFFRKHTLFGRTLQDGLGALGNGLTLYVGALAWYGLALANEDWRGYEASKTLLSAMTITALATLTLKQTITDGRPDGGSHDFPSGHSALSMATAATLDGLYGHAVGFPAYGLATLVGLQRLDTGKHDTGAVVFGWTLGYVIGHTLATHEAPRIFGLRVGLALDPERGGVGLSLWGGT
ncbi:MAG: phosphatase PAP2 family protein [Planctomycetota bacterium]